MTNDERQNKVVMLCNIVPDKPGGYHNYYRGRVYSPLGISPAVCVWGGDKVAKITEMQHNQNKHNMTHQSDNKKETAEPKIMGYSRDKNGKVTNFHPKDEANAIHGSTGHGGNTDQFVDENNTRLRIRKLTEREVFRLMDVDEEYIDKMMSCGVSRTKLYFAAGNSIVVACMEKMFENLFFPADEVKSDTNGQLSMF